MRFSFAGKRVIITGGSRGIGRAIALAFAGSGARVSACARGQMDLDALAKEMADLGSAGHVAPCDLGDPDQITGNVEAAAAALGGVDILINNASGMPNGDGEEAWDLVMRVDLLATIRASRAAEAHLAASTGASIINITSISAFRPSARTPAYAAVKAALVHYTASQALALAKKGIRANSIAPGSIEFPGGNWEKRKTTEPALYNRILQSIPFGRLGTPEEIAHVALFLASPYASWITGQTIAVDGGQLLG